MSTSVASLPAISLKQAIESIRVQFPKEAAVIDAAVRKDIVTLGTDECFALTGPNGTQIKAFKSSLTLSVANGGLSNIPGVGIIVAAQGYEMWAEVAGASVIFPKEVIVDGQWMPNPAPVRDPNNRRLLGYYVRAIAFRYSPLGIPQVCDWTVNYDIPSRRMIELLAKAKKFPQAFRLLPSSLGAPPDKDPEGTICTWGPYPFDETMQLWVNSSHDEALDWYGQLMNGEKNSLALSQTFARRNALKHLSGLQKARITSMRTWLNQKKQEVQSPVWSPEWTIPVICWRSDSGNIVRWDATAYANLQDRVGGLIEDRSKFQTVDVGSIGKIEVKVGSESASESSAEEQMALLEEAEPEELVIDVESEPAREEPPPASDTPSLNSSPSQPADDDAKVMANYEEAKSQFPGEFEAACKELKLLPKAKHSVNQAKTIIAKINANMDQE